MSRDQFYVVNYPGYLALFPQKPNKKQPFTEKIYILMICQMCLLSYSHLFFLGFIEMRNGMSCLLDGRASGDLCLCSLSCKSVLIGLDWLLKSTTSWLITAKSSPGHQNNRSVHLQLSFVFCMSEREIWVIIDLKTKIWAGV